MSYNFYELTLPIILEVTMSQISEESVLKHMCSTICLDYYVLL